MNYYMFYNHTRNLKILIFFMFRHSFRGLTPLKLKNFVQKLKIYPIPQNISQRSSWESCIINSLHHTLEFENFNFYWVSSLISWANTFKTQAFRPKIENFPHPTTYFTTFVFR